jgi:hypothetical protein
LGARLVALKRGLTRIRPRAAPAVRGRRPSTPPRAAVGRGVRACTPSSPRKRQVPDLAHLQPPDHRLVDCLSSTASTASADAAGG